MNRQQLHRRGLRSVCIAGGAALAVLLTMAPNAANAAPQPYFITPAGTPLLPNTLYVLPYAVADQQGTAQSVNANTSTSGTITGGSVLKTQTIVSIGLPVGATGNGCKVQIQWIDWNGVQAGVSGPILVGLAQTYEFTTNVSPAATYPPYVLNVFSNLSKTIPFEGYAKIRSDCAADRRLRIDAGYEMVIPIQISAAAPATLMRVIKEIKVVRPTGNVGE